MTIRLLVSYGAQPTSTGIFHCLKRPVAGKDDMLGIGYTGDDNDMMVDGAGLRT